MTGNRVALLSKKRSHHLEHVVPQTQHGAVAPESGMASHRKRQGHRRPRPALREKAADGGVARGAYDEDTVVVERPVPEPKSPGEMKRDVRRATVCAEISPCHSVQQVPRNVAHTVRRHMPGQAAIAAHYVEDRSPNVHGRAVASDYKRSVVIALHGEAV